MAEPRPRDRFLDSEPEPRPTFRHTQKNLYQIMTMKPAGNEVKLCLYQTVYPWELSCM